MKHERIAEIVKVNKLRDHVYQAITETLWQATGSWGVATQAEKDRLLGIAEREAEKVEELIAGRLDEMMAQFVASDRDYFMATEKGIALDGEAFTIKLQARRSDVPDQVFTHRRNFMVVLTEGQLTIGELLSQADMFDGKRPAVDLAGTLRGETSEADPYNPFDLWRDQFLLALEVTGNSAAAAAYDEGGMYAGFLPDYFTFGWGPVEAVHNELCELDGRLLISDGPPNDSPAEEAA